MKEAWRSPAKLMNGKGRCKVCISYKFLDITTSICEDCKDKSFTIENS